MAESSSKSEQQWRETTKHSSRAWVKATSNTTMPPTDSENSTQVQGVTQGLQVEIRPSSHGPFSTRSTTHLQIPSSRSSTTDDSESLLRQPWSTPEVLVSPSFMGSRRSCLLPSVIKLTTETLRPKSHSHQRASKCQNFCHHPGTLVCHESSHTTICDCRTGWRGFACSKLVDHCRSDPCSFGTCVNNETGFQCACRPGYAGHLCERATDLWADPIQIYNNIIQKLGCMWVMSTSAVTVILYSYVYDRTPECVLKRHSMIALFCEHALIMIGRSPAILGLAKLGCNWMAWGSLYFMGANLMITFSLALHVYYRMRGVVDDDSEWSGLHLPLVFFGWTVPAFVCCIIMMVSYPNMGNGYTCMMDWDTNASRWFLLVVPLVLMSMCCLEDAFFGLIKIKTNDENAPLSIHLQIAKADRMGMSIIVPMQYISYLITSLAVYSGDPALYTGAFACNVTLGMAVLTTYVSSNPIVWMFVLRKYRRIRKLVVKRMRKAVGQQQTFPRVVPRSETTKV